jgi:hypothetical protein
MQEHAYISGLLTKCAQAGLDTNQVSDLAHDPSFLDSRAASYLSQLVPFIGPAALGAHRLGPGHRGEGALRGAGAQTLQVPAGGVAAFLGAMAAILAGKGRYAAPAGLGTAVATMPFVGGEAVHRLTRQ